MNKIVNNIVFRIYDELKELDENVIKDLFSLFTNKKLNYEFIRLLSYVLKLEVKIEEDSKRKYFRIYCDSVLMAEYTILKCKYTKGVNNGIVYSCSGVVTTIEYDSNKERYTRFKDFSYKQLKEYKNEIENNFYRF